jgi:DNA-3-methyladenine glycosylase II
MNRITFLIRPIPPFRLDLTAWALRRRPENIVDRWDGQTYRRVLVLEGRPVEIAVRQIGPPTKPLLQVSAIGSRLTRQRVRTLQACVQRLLGTQIDLRGFYRIATQQRELGDLVRRFRGLKPPRFPSVFESLVNAFACQQVSLAVGILFLNRLAERYGLMFKQNGVEAHAFPRPEELTAARPQALRNLGFSRHKARAIRELSSAVGGGRFDLESVTALGGDAVLERLYTLRGVGRWSAEYVLLRGLGRLHVFPGDDVGAQNKIQEYLGLRKPPNYESVRRRLVRWSPYAGLIYFHFLLHGLAQRGYLSSGPSR